MEPTRWLSTWLLTGEPVTTACIVAPSTGCERRVDFEQSCHRMSALFTCIHVPRTGVVCGKATWYDEFCARRLLHYKTRMPGKRVYSFNLVTQHAHADRRFVNRALSGFWQAVEELRPFKRWGKHYNWTCEATSMAAVNREFQWPNRTERTLHKLYIGVSFSLHYDAYHRSPHQIDCNVCPTDYEVCNSSTPIPIQSPPRASFNVCNVEHVCQHFSVIVNNQLDVILLLRQAS